VIRSWQIGEATVTGLTEYYGPVHVPGVLFPAMDLDVLRGERALFEGVHWFEAIDRLVIGIQIWIVRHAGRVILIDTGIGNHKQRTTLRANNLNTVVPAWLAAAGAAPGQVTDVVMTHLHSDHVGWNTRLEDGEWVPTFPDAAYHIPKDDYAWFREFNLSGEAKDGGSFFDSVEPIVTAGLANFVSPGDLVAGCLESVAASGHTPGQLNYWLRSRVRTAVFSGDVLHHPVQIYSPEWNSIVDILPDMALGTRATFLDKAADTGALVMPCHFGPPNCGFVRRERAGFTFQPAPVTGRSGLEPGDPWQ
jgi:glyoxylase-like metal-dependent hydrolase (beta-lactamase superfamily II)